VFVTPKSCPITARAGSIPSMDNATKDIKSAMMATNSILRVVGFAFSKITVN
jgi:hypothetical protein